MKGDLSMLGRGRRRRAWLALLLCHSSYQDVSKRGELGYVCLVSEGYVYAHDMGRLDVGRTPGRSAQRNIGEERRWIEGNEGHVTLCCQPFTRKT
jgi:hypothetical protein